jgi:uncharacterized repeat protein (TIGR03803 family)
MAPAADAVPASFAVVHSFSGTVDGHNPNSTLVLGGDGNLYGTTSGNVDGVDHGTAFRMTPGGAVTVVHQFTGADGDQPIGLTAAPTGGFYGVTQSGGTGTCPSGCGTVFAMSTAGEVTVLHSFQSGTEDGSAPNPALALAPDGSIYGTTKLGPIVPGTGKNWGIAFRLDPQTGDYAVLHKFVIADGINPQGGLVRAGNGSFYGVTNQGGPGGSGTVFRLSRTGTVTVIHGFALEDGAEPKAALLQAADGRLYGTTQLGGAGRGGVIFRMSLTGGAYTVLHAFAVDGRDGYRPITGLVQTADGRFYGTTPLGGRPVTSQTRKGVLYRMTASGTVFVMHTFSGPDGSSPYASPTVVPDGGVYGTTFVGGEFGKGVAYAVVP